MRKSLAFIFVALLTITSVAAEAADPRPFELTLRKRDEVAPRSGVYEVVEQSAQWDPRETAVIVIDVWDKHWCAGANRRVGEMVDRMSAFVNAARDRGAFIIHAPSDTMKSYEGAPGRKLAQGAPPAKPPAGIEFKWNYLDESKEGKLPIDDSDGGCDCEPQCKSGTAWKGEHPGVGIRPGDAISDNGQEIYNMLEQRGIKNILIFGVHTNMCILGRPFGIRMMTRLGKNVALVRDLTDTMYNSRMPPFVPHAKGTELVVEHVEKHWCPTILSSDILGDGRGKQAPKVVFVDAEQEYDAKETLPALAKEVERRFGWKPVVLHSDNDSIAGLEALDDANLLVMFMRRRTLPDDQLKCFKTYFDSGRPVVAMRTSSHAFQNWLEFDKVVLGGNYHSHYGNEGATTIRVADGTAAHPLLRGVAPTPFMGNGSLYKTSPLAETAKPLLIGKWTDQPEEPVAWTNMYKGGRVFYTSLGHPKDFETPQVRRLLLNAILWGADRPIPDALPGGQDANAQAIGPQGKPADVVDAVKGAKGLETALQKLHAPLRDTDPLSPQEESKAFRPRQGFAVDLVLAEPRVRQPLNITFDERGRMWVVQYVQYPFPEGLKVVEYDQYIRAKFDHVPQPPPKHLRGHDLITIHEDADGDGVFEKQKTFVEGLSIATSALPGRGGVWVLNPPYLLFYPDENHDDVPDGDPIVHLSGFGLEDTHAVANSLMWGPDGWLYGCQGSTCTAKVKVEVAGGDPSNAGTTDFLGQAIWRYHTEQHRFEVFAEGGGNTFGLEFDDKGRAFSGTNWGNYRGLYYVQGGYYVKGWGKHGPLTNPYAFGYFEHMPHTGNADRLTHTYVVYGGGLFPERFNGAIIGPSPLMSRVQVTTLKPMGSSFSTVEDPFLLTCDDGWFRPVDLKVGPEGALYLADFYEKRISHVDPRDNWHRENGRIWRIRPADAKPGTPPTDLGKRSSAELVSALDDKNRLVRATARRILADRKDASVAPELKKRLISGVGQTALEALWALHVVGGLDEASASQALDHRDPFVRMWTVRLLGDDRRTLAPSLEAKILELAARESDPQVRSQLASTAKRLPGEQALPLIARLVRRTEDRTDPHIPLLLWWAIESKAVSDRDRILSTFGTADAWTTPLVREFIMQRLARRYSAEPTEENQDALMKLLAAAPSDVERKVLLTGVNEAFAGKRLEGLAPPLIAAISELGDMELSLRAGDDRAHEQALRLIANDDEAVKQKRIHTIELLGEVGRPEAAQALLRVAESSRWHSVRRAALTALGRFDDESIAREIVAFYSRLPADQDVRPTALATLLSRPRWTEQMLRGAASGAIPLTDLSPAQLDQIHQSDDAAVATLAKTSLGKALERPTTEEKRKEMDRIVKLVRAGEGDPSAGKSLFNATCATCHRLFGEGQAIGPDLTGYDRRNLDEMIVHIVDPSAYIREEFAAFRIRTKRGQSLYGVITERAADRITLVDTFKREKIVVARSDIRDERAMTTSMMPEDLLKGFSDGQLRDFFAYLASAGPQK